MKMFNLIFLALTAFVSMAFSAKKGSESSFAYMSETTPFKYSKFKDLIIFGDSYSTVSMNVHTMNYTGYNMSGGKNWPQFLIDPIHPMNMWNFAVNGASVDPSIFGSIHATPMTLQYQQFLNTMSTGMKYNTWDGETTLFAIWFGINDLGAKSRYYYINDEINDDSIDEKIVDSMFEMIEGCYKEGARNFMFITVPNIERCPRYSSGIKPEIKSYIQTYNNVLNSHAKEFQASHPDTNVMVYDSYSEFEYIMKNKAEYNITNITGECNGIKLGTYRFYGVFNICDTKEYFWSDYIHPTPAVHEPLAYDIDAFLKANEI